MNELSGESEELVLKSLKYWGWWALAPKGVFFLEEDVLPWKTHLKYLNLHSKQVSELRTLEYPADDVFLSLALSADDRHVLFGQIENRGSKIVMIENFR